MLCPSKNTICKNPLYQLLEKLDWKFIPDRSTAVFFLFIQQYTNTIIICSLLHGALEEVHF